MNRVPNGFNVVMSQLSLQFVYTLCILYYIITYIVFALKMVNI